MVILHERVLDKNGGGVTTEMLVNDIKGYGYREFILVEIRPSEPFLVLGDPIGEEFTDNLPGHEIKVTIYKADTRNRGRRLKKLMEQDGYVFQEDFPLSEPEEPLGRELSQGTGIVRGCDTL